MGNELQFDTDKIREIQRRLAQTLEEMDGLLHDTQTALEQIRNEWHTPAGAKFFEDYNTKFSASQKYLQDAKVISDLLARVASKYDGVSAAAQRLNL